MGDSLIILSIYPQILWVDYVDIATSQILSWPLEYGQARGGVGMQTYPGGWEAERCARVLGKEFSFPFVSILPSVNYTVARIAVSRSAATGGQTALPSMNKASRWVPGRT